MNLLKISICVVCAYALISCGGAEERKSVYLEKARVSFNSGDLEKARIEIKNVIQIDPKDSEAIYFLGKVYEKQQDYRKAFAHFKKAEELNPDLLENKAKLGRMYLIFTTDTEKVQQRIDYILAKDPENASGLLLKAAMLLKSKKTAEALQIAEKINAKDPGHVDTVSFLATLYVNEKRMDDSVAVLEKSLTINPENEELNKLMALIYVKNKNYDKAEVLYVKFLERNPDNPASYNNLAAFYNQSGDKVKAVKTLRASVENDSSDVERQLTVVKYIKTIKSTDEAISELKTYIANNRGLGRLRSALAELLYINGNKEEAIKVHNTSIKEFSEEVTGVEARIALAAIYLTDQEFDKASKVVDDALLISPNDPKVNLLLARIALNDKDFETATIALRIVTKEMPENINAYLLLAGIYKQEDNQDQVRNTLHNAYVNNKTNHEALLVLAQYHLSRDIDKAEKIIDDYNNIKQDDYRGLSIKSSVLNQQKRESEAIKIANGLMEAFPEKPNGYLQSIPYYSKQGDMKKAISVLETGYLNVEDNRKLLVLLTTLQASDNQIDVAINRIKAELKASPDDAELKILLSKVHLANKDTQSGVAILNDVISTNPGIEEPYLLLSQVHQLAKEESKTESILTKGKENVPNSIKIPLRLAALNELNGRYDIVIQIYKDLYAKRPGNLIVTNNLASTITDHSDNKDDLALAEKIVGKLKDSGQAVFLDTVGWLYHKLGDGKKAVEYLQQAVDMQPEIHIFNYHLGMAYKLSGNNVKAKVYLEKSLDSGKPFKQMDDAKAALDSL